jgi:CheY-like chemotaxis protein
MTARPSILVVEDNYTEQRLLGLLLEKFGYHAVIVGNAAAAIELIQHNYGFDVILMDWQLKDMDGLDCTREIRRIEDHRQRYTPIVAVTARVMHGDRQQCLRAGMDDYLSKPYSMLQLRNMLSKWITNNRDSESMIS